MNESSRMCQISISAEVHEHGEDGGGRQLDPLRGHQREPAIVAIGDDAADEREEHDRQLLQERVEAEDKTPTAVSDSTSQFSARLCIQVPMLEAQAPNQSTRKSRWCSAAANAPQDL